MGRGSLRREVQGKAVKGRRVGKRRIGKGRVGVGESGVGESREGESGAWRGRGSNIWTCSGWGRVSGREKVVHGEV